MLKILTCLTVDHDWRLVLVAALVCVVATVTAFRLYALAVRNEGGLRPAWIAFGGLAAGCGIWATHFIAMLAYAPKLVTGYAPGGTLLSLVLAVGATAVGFGVAARKSDLRHFIAGGVLLGAGVSAMHYVGMAAFRIQGTLSWDPAYLIASVSVGVLVAIAAVAAAGSASRWRDQLLGAGLFTLSICSMHFTGMSAVTILPDPSIVVPHRVLDRDVMAMAVTALAAVIVLAALGTVIIQALLRQSSLARLRSAIDAIPHPLAIFDAEDRLAIWNTRYAELNHHAEDVLIPGTPFRTVIQAGIARGHYPEAAGREAGWLQDRLARRRAAPSTFEQEIEGGGWLRIEERRMPDGGVVSICVDLTDMKRNEIALAAARDEAEAANRAKSEFLANMSHEIRTPLNGMMGVADVLAKTRLSLTQRDLVQTVRDSSVVLERLLSDVLDLARVESGRLQLRPEPFDLGAAARAAASLYQPCAAQKDVALIVDVAPEAEAWVFGDAMRIKQILGNLISNAVKFTDVGEVRLTVAASDVAGAWRLSVSDTGVGVSDADRARIFGRFEQADGSATRRFGGSGLGLAICRQLAALMGGEIECENGPKAGSIFRLVVDLPPCAREDAAPPAHAQDIDVVRRGAAPLRVLLADDHPTNRKVVALILDQAGVDLAVVEDGAQALEAFRRGSFDAVLMDMQMPVMDGLSATRAIRDFEREGGIAATPVIMLTANALPEHVEASRAAGADRHLTKPIGAPALLGALNEIVEAAEGRKAA